jgi:hypothetical protein
MMDAFRAIADYIIVGGGGLILFLLGVLWQWAQGTFNRLEVAHDEHTKELNDFKVEVAKTYPSRQTLKDMLQPIMEELQKIDQRQQRFIERLEDRGATR